MNKIVIVVEGGVVQAVSSTEEIEYVIVDEDIKKMGGQEIPLDVYSPDIIIDEKTFERMRNLEDPTRVNENAKLYMCKM